MFAEWWLWMPYWCIYGSNANAMRMFACIFTLLQLTLYIQTSACTINHITPFCLQKSFVQICMLFFTHTHTQNTVTHTPAHQLLAHLLQSFPTSSILTLLWFFSLQTKWNYEEKMSKSHNHTHTHFFVRAPLLPLPFIIKRTIQIFSLFLLVSSSKLPSIPLYI